MHFVVIAHVGPAAHQRPLPHLRHVGKAVIVVVVGLGEQFVVAEEGSAPAIRELEIGSWVGFQFLGAIDIEVCIGPGCGLRLLICASISIIKKKSLFFQRLACCFFVIRLGFEPKTPTLKVLCSTD